MIRGLLRAGFLYAKMYTIAMDGAGDEETNRLFAGGFPGDR